MTSCGYEILDRAIAGRMAGVLTVPPDEGRQWQVRFLAHDAEQDGIWAEPVNESCQPLDPLFAGGVQLQAAIGIDHSRYAFRTRIVRRNKHFWLTETMMFDALLLGGPIELVVAERRAHPRFQIPDSSNVFCQITCRSSASPLRVRPWDVSAGGISFLCPRDPAAMNLKPDEPLDFVISYRGRSVGGTGSVRFTRFITERVIKLGVQFATNSMDEISRNNLQYFLADVTRLARPRLVPSR